MDRRVFDAEYEDFSKADPTTSQFIWASSDETDHKDTFVSSWNASRSYLNLTALLLVLA
jgi:hypothetical protein